MVGIKGRSGSGGKREGSGRKLKYGEPVKRLTFQVPESKAEEITELVQKRLNKWIKNK
jgi:hypothetical protein